MSRHALLCLVVFVCAIPRAAAAQTKPATKWEIEGLAGVSLGRIDWGGEATLPPAGAPIETSSPVFPSWRVPSWMFGDGAAFLNSVAGEFGAVHRVTPLDGLFEPSGLSGGHFQMGVRVRRVLAAPYSLEMGMEFGVQPLSISTDLRDGLDATAASFTSTLGDILSPGPFGSPVISANVSTVSGSARELMLTVALSADTRPFGKFVPYGTAGGGLLRQSGELASGTITGNYRFQINGTVPINETDTTTLAYRGSTTFVGLFGGGVRRDFSPQWGLRIDARFLIGPSPLRAEITGSPRLLAILNRASERPRTGLKPGAPVCQGSGRASARRTLHWSLK